MMERRFLQLPALDLTSLKKIVEDYAEMRKKSCQMNRKDGFCESRRDRQKTGKAQSVDRDFYGRCSS